MSFAPAAAALSISSRPRSSVAWRWSVTGACWTTATLCEPPRLGTAYRVVAGPREHARQVLAELPTEPSRDRDERVEVDAGLDAEPAQQVDEILGRDVPGRVRRERATAGSAHRRVQRRYT